MSFLRFDSPKEILKAVFFLLLNLAFVFFIFSLSSDFSEHLQFKSIFLACVFFLTLLFSKKLDANLDWKNPILILLGIFLLWQSFRAWGIAPGIRNPELLITQTVADAYQKAPMVWGACFAGFFLSLMLTHSRSAAVWFLRAVTLSGVVIALNILPNLLIHGPEKPYYYTAVNKFIFFPAVFQWGWVQKYLLSSITNNNILGDLMAMGFFSALGLALYRAYQLKNENVDSELKGRILRSLVTYSAAALQVAAAILLLYSRGTIVFWFLTLSIFLLITMIRFPSKAQIVTTLGFLVLFLGFVFWAGDLRGAWKEIQTLKGEEALLKNESAARKDVTVKSRSILTNKEGYRVSMLLRQKYPWWGVGTQGYPALAKYYVKKDPVVSAANHYAMSHYFQKMAEEGKGAFLYFFILAVFVLEFFRKLFGVQSRFQFITASALAAPVFLILMHASINHVLEHVTVLIPVFMLMGASLSVLSKNFQHEF